MIEYRILPPEASETGAWQLEIRDKGGWVWSIEVFDTYGDALDEARKQGYLPWTEGDK